MPYSSGWIEYDAIEVTSVPIVKQRIANSTTVSALPDRRNGDLIWQAAYSFTDRLGNKCSQPGFWYHKSVRDQAPKIIESTPEVVKPAIQEKLPTARPATTIEEKSDQVEEEPDIVRGQALLVRTGNDGVPVKKPSYDGTASPMSTNPKLPKYATNGVNSEKISKMPGGKLTSNGPLSEAFNVRVKEIEMMRQGDRDKIKPELKDDTEKPFVTIVATTEEKRKAALKDFEESGVLGGWRDKIRLRAVAPTSWEVLQVGLPVKGDPSVIIQNQKGYTSLLVDYDPSVVDHTLRRPNPHFDPKKVPDGRISFWDGLWDGLAFRQFWNSHLAGASGGSTSLVLKLACIGILALLVFLPDNKKLA